MASLPLRFAAAGNDTGRRCARCLASLLSQARTEALDALAGVSGIGAKKLQAYGEEVLRVVAGAGLGHNLRP